jgi:hypothetical protein
MMIEAISALPQPQDFHPLELPGAGQPVADDDPSPRNNDVSSLGFSGVLEVLRSGGATLERAEQAENAFVAGTGGLQEMVFERAKADAVVSVAAAATSRVAQSLATLSQIQL